MRRRDPTRSASRKASRLLSGVDTEGRDGRAIQEEFQLPRGRVTYVWELLDDGVLVTLESDSRADDIRLISLPGSFRADGLATQLAVPIMQGLLYDGRGEAFEESLSPWRPCGLLDGDGRIPDRSWRVAPVGRRLRGLEGGRREDAMTAAHTCTHVPRVRSVRFGTLGTRDCSSRIQASRHSASGIVAASRSGGIGSPGPRRSANAHRPSACSAA